MNTEKNTEESTLAEKQSIKDAETMEIAIGVKIIGHTPEQKKRLLPNSTYEDELWDADPDCEHEIVSASGGGIKCKKCGGWFCY